MQIILSALRGIVWKDVLKTSRGEFITAGGVTPDEEEIPVYRGRYRGCNEVVMKKTVNSE
uniref:Uncharacterized protein n=1 Tax=Engystomops pustulosus TaxID=76066 RepID=A0AAV6YE83_ENGPU|nr:hypothetical protein GDO81_027615 [Engystomops pustulosus]